MIDSERGRIAVGWLIVEDLAMVLALVLIPAFAGAADGHSTEPLSHMIETWTGINLGIPGILAVTLVKIAAFVGFMLVVGRWLIPMALHYTAHTGSRELFRLAVLAIALGAAAGAAFIFGVSLALGAFFAGMILSESELSHRAAEETLPLRDAFAVLFFVAVGMLFDPMTIITDPLPIIATVLIILIGKSVFAFGLVMAFRMPLATAATVAVSLAQVGEFSFILAALGVSLGILPEAGQSLILGGAIISIILNPLLFWLADMIVPKIEARLAAPVAHSEALREPEVEVAATEAASATLPGPPAGHTILVGYGRVGVAIAERLVASGEKLVVIEAEEDRANAARAAGLELIPGNAATGDALLAAHITTAAVLFVAIPNAFEAGQAIEQGRRANPAVRIIARAHSDEEAAHLASLGADQVVMGEREIGNGMVELSRRNRPPG